MDKLSSLIKANIAAVQWAGARIAWSDHWNRSSLTTSKSSWTDGLQCLAVSHRVYRGEELSISDVMRERVLRFSDNKRQSLVLAGLQTALNTLTVTTSDPGMSQMF